MVKKSVNREDECDVTKIPICEIMGLKGIFRKSKTKKCSFAKNQPFGANWRVDVSTSMLSIF